MAFDQPLGLSFLPPGNATDTSGPAGNRLEDVLRIISLRLPRILGAHPIVAPELAAANQGPRDPLAEAIVKGVLANVIKGSPITGGQGTAGPIGGTNIGTTGGPSLPSSPSKPSINFEPLPSTGIPEPFGGAGENKGGEFGSVLEQLTGGGRRTNVYNY